MGALTTYLQREFKNRCPEGWCAEGEAALLPHDLNELLGYAARADVLLTNATESRRIWIEFEVSRADPIANHGKFATSHLFSRQQAGDVFVSMISRHITRGRRNLASSTISLMRRVGMRAHQTVLLPLCSGNRIKELNQMSIDDLGRIELDSDAELDRAMTVVSPIKTTGEGSVHLVGEPWDVRLNLIRWNDDVRESPGRELWNCRTIKYFVFDVRSNSFAPSKFCAYSVIGDDASGPLIGMSIVSYLSIDSEEPVFDGTRAWQHLHVGLGMERIDFGVDPRIDDAFGNWIARYSTALRVHPTGPVFLRCEA